MAQKLQPMGVARDMASRYGFEAIPFNDGWGDAEQFCKKLKCKTCGREYRPRSYYWIIHHWLHAHR